jgi:hypothetical protein
MAQLDLKNCDFYIEDGYTGSQSITGVGAASIAVGGASISVSGFSGTVTTGDQFTLAGDVDSNGYPITHTVTGSHATGGNTDTIAFTPVTSDSVASGAIITWLPHSLKIKIGEGNMQWTEKRPVVYVKDRGKLDTVRLGDQEPVEVKLDFLWVFLSSTNGSLIPQPSEAIKQTGPSASWISSSSDPCEPYAVNIRVVYTPPCDVTREQYKLHDFRYEDLGMDMKTGQISVTGKCNVMTVTDLRG